MKKSILIPIIAIVLAAAILLGVSAGLSGMREANAQAELQDRLKTILPGGESFTEEAYTGEDTNIRGVYRGENGYVLLVATNGYADEIAMLVGVSSQGKVTGLQIRDLHETAGLGSRALTDADFLAQFLNNEGDAAVGTNIDAITGATVTSKAVARCINSAVAFVTGADVSSSATTWGG